MNSLFWKLTSRHPVLRRYSLNDSSSSSQFNIGNPIWIQIRDRRGSEGEGDVRALEERRRLWQALLDINIKKGHLVMKSLYKTPSSSYYSTSIDVDHYNIQYTSGEWKPITANREELDSRIGGRKLALLPYGSLFLYHSTTPGKTSHLGFHLTSAFAPSIRACYCYKELEGLY